MHQLGQRYPIQMILLLSGDVHQNPGPLSNKCLKFFHWNLNSFCTRDRIKISLIETYNALHKFDIIAVSESMLDNSIKNDEIIIEGFSEDIFRSDHPSNTKTGGVCLYAREGLPIRRRADLKLLQEIVITEINISRKKIFLGTIYRSPSQSSQQFEYFIDKLQMVLDKLKGENPQCIILTGGFNCRSCQWWTEDIEQPEGTALEELIETNGLYQLIDEPTNIRNGGMSCIDLIITDQPNMFVDYGVHPSLDDHCQHQIIYGKISASVPSAPPYKRTIWDYPKANVQAICDSINAVNWSDSFRGLDSEGMVKIFTDKRLEDFAHFIPNKIVQFNDKDQPWITPQLKSAIKRKHRIYSKFVQSGRKQELWKGVKNMQIETSRLIASAKKEYYANLGKKLSDPKAGAKTYWSLFNKLINKKKFSNIPPLFDHGLFVTNVEAKANIFNDYFVSQCCAVTTGSTIPSFISRGLVWLQNIEIDREKVLRLIRSLDTNKAHGCDAISSSMIKICDESIVEPLCLIFENCLESGVYPPQWKKANIIPIHKRAIDRARKTIAQFRCCQSLERFSKNFCLMRYTAIYAKIAFCPNINQVFGQAIQQSISCCQ